MLKKKAKTVRKKRTIVTRQPDLLAADTTTIALSNSEQTSILDWIGKGASPQGACEREGISYKRFAWTRNHVPDFRTELEGVLDMLTDNMMARLYQEGMKGSSTAMGLWLKLFPPRSQQRFSATDMNREDVLTDGELWERVMEEATSLALARSAGDAATLCDETSRVFSTLDPDRREGTHAGEGDHSLAGT